MKTLFQIFCAVFIMNFFSCAQQDRSIPDSTQPGIEAANLWMSLVNEGKYGESWEQAAAFFKKAVTKSDWEKSLNGILPALGKLVSREVLSATFKTSLPGAPDGEYVVIQYKTKFEKKAEAIETVTPMKDTDGIWRVAGYFIK